MKTRGEEKRKRRRKEEKKRPACLPASLPCSPVRQSDPPIPSQSFLIYPSIHQFINPSSPQASQPIPTTDLPDQSTDARTHARTSASPAPPPRHPDDTQV
ncbi:hypothetical protein BC567DRAFT_227653 [Phyllosticta citribraziliensis]